MHIRSENGTAVWNADRCCADFKGFKADAQIMDFWELYSFKHSQPDDQNIELISDDVKASWGDDLQSVKVSVDKGLWNGRLYLLRRDILKVHKATHGIEDLPNRYNDSAIDKEIKERNREPEVLFTKFKTSQDTRGIALGVMAKLIAQSKPNKLIRGGKVNASELVKMMEQECARLGIGSLSGEVRKDISQCVDAVEKEINKKHTNQ
ncbi:hypothetical protein HLG76_14225 [Salinivibrio sp. EAGSL]|uniref:hypothetical protein n=1 Tax=Salinivibrio sp. EAGSL TaxID=2738468 RepID=UPI00158ECC04|nr:hypothetical protein [Salinivibrio sp. EAGSL]NUY57675.1 hypothetical protein [Salinivibrio sp. EAGSL]